MDEIRVNCKVRVYYADGSDDVEYITCNGFGSVSREKYGEDADGNRGVYVTYVEDEEPDIESLEEELYAQCPDIVRYEVVECEVERD